MISQISFLMNKKVISDNSSCGQKTISDNIRSDIKNLDKMWDAFRKITAQIKCSGFNSSFVSIIQFFFYAEEEETILATVFSHLLKLLK